MRLSQHLHEDDRTEQGSRRIRIQRAYLFSPEQWAVREHVKFITLGVIAVILIEITMGGLITKLFHSIFID